MKRHLLKPNLAAAIALSMIATQAEAPPSREPDLSRVPLSDLELGPGGIQIKKGSPSDPLRRHRKQHR